MTNWETTVAGILSGLIGTCTTLSMIQLPSTIANPQATHIWLYVTFGCTVAASVGRVWIGLLQNDAPPNPPTTKP